MMDSNCFSRKRVRPQLQNIMKSLGRIRRKGTTTIKVS